MWLTLAGLVAQFNPEYSEIKPEVEMIISNHMEHDKNQYNDFRLDNSEVIELDIQVDMDSNVLKELCEYFPKGSGNAYPKAVQYLFGGKRRFVFYFANSSNERFRNSINMILASDVENENNNLVLSYLSDKTLSFYGKDSEAAFTITKISLVHRLVGSFNNRTIKADVMLYYSHPPKMSGLPHSLLNKIMRLPNNYEITKAITDRITHWDEYLKISENIALESQLLVGYSSYKKTKKEMQLSFKLVSSSITNNPVNSSIILVIDEEVEDGLKSYKGPLIGTVKRYNRSKNELVVDLDFEFNDLLLDDKTNIPNSSRLFISKYGDLVQLKRLRNGLKSFSRGQAMNPYLDVFMFDSSKARLVNMEKERLTGDDLLQNRLNNEQIEAVEGVLNSHDMFLIQGPPGTGKTTVIAEICYQNAIRGKKTLIASQTNLAVDNALSKLVYHPKIRALRKGNEQSVQEEGILFVEGNVIDTWLNKIANYCKETNSNRKSNIALADKTIQNLKVINDKFNVYKSLKLEHNLRLEDIQNNEAQITILKSKLDWVEKSFIDAISNTRSKLVDEIVEDPYFAGRGFITIVKNIYNKSNEIEGNKSICENNILEYKNEIGKLVKLIQSMKPIYNKFCRKIDQEDFEENNLEMVSHKVSESRYKVMLIEQELNLIIQNKPLTIFLYLGFSKMWLLSFAALKRRAERLTKIIEFNKDNEKLRLKELIDDKTIHGLVLSLKLCKDEIKQDIENEVNIFERELSYSNIELEFLKKSINEIRNEVESINLNLPFDIKADLIDDICNKDDIEKYYFDLLKFRLEDEKKLTDLISKWSQKIVNIEEEDYLSLKIMYINNANVIGITCNQSGSKEFTDIYPTFDIVVIDEVSKATPPELILPALKARKIVLVGDHKQLPPMIGNETYDEVANKLNIPEERINHLKGCLFEELYVSAPKDIKIMLSTQYRMHDQIMNLINQFYKDENQVGLNCGLPDPDIYRNHNCFGKTIKRDDHAIWIDIPLEAKNREEQAKASHSFSNRSEVECIKDILITLSSNLEYNKPGIQKRVGVISFYKDQVNLLEDELLDVSFRTKINNLSLRIGSVDKFQGIECEIIICSFVRNNERGEIGFAKDPRRVNVALSRAQELLIIVGSIELFCLRNRSTSGGQVYQNIVNNIQKSGGIKSALDFIQD